MPRNVLEMPFADGSYAFALTLPRIDELQRKRGCGIGAIFKRTLTGCIRVGDEVIQDPKLADFDALDLVETIRQGLIGGGRGTVDGSEVKMTPVLAQRLIDSYVLTEPLSEAWSLAASILGATIVGYDPEPPKKKEVKSAEKRTRKAG